jgi:hypothetical protein
MSAVVAQLLDAQYGMPPASSPKHVRPQVPQLVMSELISASQAAVDASAASLDGAPSAASGPASVAGVVTSEVHLDVDIDPHGDLLLNAATQVGLVDDTRHAARVDDR